MSETEQEAPDARALLLAQIREAYGRVAYTHKTHEKQADIYFEKDRWQRGFLVVLTAISSGAFLASLLGLVLDESWGAVVTSFIAVVVSAISLAGKTFKYGELTQSHRDAASQLWNLRETYQSLIVDLQSAAIPVDEGRRRRDAIQREALSVYADAPRTSAKAYAKAQDGLKDKEDLTFTKHEIDLLLPVDLRSSEEPSDDGDE